MKIILLAGTQSGCGKTTITLALLQYLKQQKQRITAFKVGPDFLDPYWHQTITGRASYNVDTQMVGLVQSRQLINQQSRQVDIALIEGVMGLFDGRIGVGQEGSSADLAKGLGCSIILVVNAKGISGSIVPLVSGYCDYAKKIGVQIVGIIANYVGSQHHVHLLTQLLADNQLPPIIAWMEKQAPVLAERHLGLALPQTLNIPDFQPFFHVNEPSLALVFTEWTPSHNPIKQLPRLHTKIIAIAKDAACCFIYPANIDCLIAQGAVLHYFSVINGDSVPENATALWLPGGYPELYAAQLSQSDSLLSIKQFIASGKPVLAECGGSMLLGQSLLDLQGVAWSMAGVLPFNSVMQKKRVALGYREEMSGIKGHEFHYSKRQLTQAIEPCFDCVRGDTGIRYKNLRASYIHWYFASAPEVIADWLSLRQ